MVCICFARIRPQNKVFLKNLHENRFCSTTFSATIFIEIIDNLKQKRMTLLF